MSRVARWSWIGVLWLGVACPAVSAGEMSDLFPEGTILYLNWPGLDQLSQSCEDTALGRIMAEPQMAPLREKLMPALVALIKKQAASQAEEELAGVACDLARSLGKYPFAVGLGSVGGGGTMVDAALVVRAGKDAPKLQDQVEKLARRAELPLDAATTLPADSKLKMKELAILGPLMPIRWGVVGDDFIVSLGTKTTDLLIGSDGVKRLTGSPHFTAAMKATGGSGAPPLLYLDLAETVRTLEAFQAMFAAGDVPILGVPGGLRKVLDETGLGKLESLTLVQTPQAGGFRTTFFARVPGMGRSEGNGLCGEPLTDADLALVPKDATSASVDNGDVAELYRWGLNLTKILGPEVADPVSQGIAEVEKRLGMKVDEDLLAGFGDTWVWYNSPSAGGFWFTGLTVIAEVKADNKLDQGLQAIVKAIAEAADAEDQVTVQHETYRDQTITFVNCPGVPMPIAPAWTIYKNRWVMALYPQMVRTALDHMMNQGPSLLDNADFQRGYQLLPKGASSVVYSDTAEGVRQLYAIGLPVSQLLLSIGQGEGLELDASVLPSLTCISKHLFGDVGCLVAVPDGWMMVGHGPLPVEIPSMGEGGMAIPLAVSILLPSLARARETAREMVSLTNLKSIGIGLHMYASEHHGNFPPDLNTLLKAGTIKPEILISPLDRDPSRKCSYIYVAGHTDKSNPGDILAYERPPSGGKERIGVLFLDGHAERMSMTAFEEALKNTAERLGRPLKAGEENEGAPVKEKEQREESK
ncbi:MAG: DUF1559 domain-containing protein [Phycisphaerae bacterium]|nr:DUF1559 domain-containing protein [Phycisphaerae bacterium]